MGTTELLYAGDTILIDSKAEAIDKLIATIVKHSERFGLRLSVKKYEYFGIILKGKKKRNTEIVLPDGTALSNVQHTTYLGGNIQANGSAKNEVESRISRAACAFNKSKPVEK